MSQIARDGEDARCPLDLVARDLSFPSYVLHLVLLTAAANLSARAHLGLRPRWGISVAVAWAVVAACTAVLRYIPSLQSLFTIRPPQVMRHPVERAA